MLRHHADVLAQEEKSNRGIERLDIQPTLYSANEVLLASSLETHNPAMNDKDSFLYTAAIRGSSTELPMGYSKGYHAPPKFEIADPRRSELIAFMDNECSNVCYVFGIDY
jgi:hypothetical protein